MTEDVEKTGTTQNWIQQFGYDRYGNRTSFSQDIGGITNNTTPAVDANTNRFTSNDFGYDKNGNIVEDIDSVSSLPREFIFNGDNKQVEVKKDGVTIGRYFYDGEGKRVKKITDTETTVFVYSGGKLIAEYSTELSATPSTAYLTNDHLGSPRVVTDELGQVKSRRDFMPFGEELYVNVGGRTPNLEYGSSEDDVRQKFTGYQKDDETNLDFAEARMYQNLHGRFTAIDPLLASGKSDNPQTFNRYIYVGNNPIIFTDPLGLDWLRSKERNEDGDYTYTDFNGKELKKMLKSGNWQRVDFGNADSHHILNGDGQVVYEMFAAGGGRAIDPNRTFSPPPVTNDQIADLLSSFAESYDSKSRTVRMAATVAGTAGVCIGTAGAGCAPAVRLGTAIIEDEMSTATTSDRRAGVREAWRLEAEAIRNGGMGSRNWTAAERQELIDTGKVSGYEGHHINSVNEHPQLAREPDNIKFVDGRNGRKEHLKEHRGNFRNSTRGPLIRRR